MRGLPEDSRRARASGGTVVEIGPGVAPDAAPSRARGPVVAFEIDAALAAALRREFAARPFGPHGDALEVDVAEALADAGLAPRPAGGQPSVRLGDADAPGLRPEARPLLRLVVMIQKEVATGSSRDRGRRRMAT